MSNSNKIENGYSSVHPEIMRITKRIIARSKNKRALPTQIEQARSTTVHRAELACGNLAHGFAACQPEDKEILKSMTRSDIAIINSYNDMLSAHRPYDNYPERLKKRYSNRVLLDKLPLACLQCVMV